MATIGARHMSGICIRYAVTEAKAVSATSLTPALTATATTCSTRSLSCSGSATVTYLIAGTPE